MWIVAGILLGVVLVTLLAGFHAGPHAHVVTGVVGAVLAGWLILMTVEGRMAPVLWALLGVDTVVAGGAGVLAWQGLRAATRPTRPLFRSLVGAEGVALSDLDPQGTVRVAGEEWSVESVNGRVPAGGRVQVLRADGVRLEVWGEDRGIERGHPGLESQEQKP